MRGNWSPWWTRRRSAFPVGPATCGRERRRGLFHLDTRLLSRLELQVDGAPLEPLSVAALTPFAATFAARARSDADGLDSPLLVLQRRYVGRGLREDIEVRNYGREPITVDVQLRYGVDFADLFAVKEGRVHTTAPPVHRVHDHAVEFNTAKAPRTGACRSVPNTPR